MEDLNQAIRADPAHAAYYRGLIYYGDDNPDGVGGEFDDVLKSDPGNSAIYNSRGAAYNASVRQSPITARQSGSNPDFSGR